MNSKQMKQNFFNLDNQASSKVGTIAFLVVHTPDGTLGMANYMSRPPFLYDGPVIRLEQLLNDRFTINKMNAFVNGLDEKF